MGEELELSNLVIKLPDGKIVPWEQVTWQPTVEKGKDCSGEVFACLDRNQEMWFECTGHVDHWFMLRLLCGSDRMVRRALRWKERIRRDFLKGKHEMKREDWETVAILCAKKCGNNRRKNGR